MNFINLNKKPALDNESIAKIKKELNGWIKIKDELNKIGISAIDQEFLNKKMEECDSNIKRLTNLIAR